MSQNGELLMRHVKAAQTTMAGGLDYSASDGKYWAVSDQKHNGKQTGNIAVVCVDDNALTELVTNLRAEGYTIEEIPSTNDDAGALVITPPAS